MISCKTEIETKENPNINFDDLKHLKIVKELILYLFNVMPENYHERFMENLLELNLVFKLGNKNKTTVYNEVTNRFYNRVKLGAYKFEENKIEFYLNSLIRYWSDARDALFKMDYIRKNMSFTILHELTHLASHRVDKDKNQRFSGFLTHGDDSTSDDYVGIDEAMTELITYNAFPSLDNQIYSIYDFNIIFVGQLCAILSFEFMVDQYFKADGISEIINKLKEYTKHEKYEHIFNIIEFFYYDGTPERVPNGFYKGPGIVQEYFFDVFIMELSNKVYNDISSFEILRYVSNYEKYIITPERLSLMNLSAEDFPRIKETYEAFLGIKKYMLHYGAAELKIKAHQRTKTC